VTAADRREHLAWCKQRALEYVDAGDVDLALASLISDLGKHPSTVRTGQIVAEAGTMLAAAGELSTPEKMREWINGVG
jgi:hypothetical protein